jgi:hypothetical protein
MNPQILLNKPKIEPNLIPKITKLGNFSTIVESSVEIKKSSTKLKKVFEKGTYQKKTQLVVLNRYKKRLDSIQKQNDKRFSEKKKVKIKPPDIKKYTGSLFTAGGVGDPLKMMAGLAALNAFTKLKNGNLIDAIGPGLVAAGLLFGPSAIKGGIGMMRGGGTSNQGTASGRAFVPPTTGNRTVFGGITSRLGRVGSPTGTAGIRSNIGLGARQFQAGAFMQTPGARAAFPVALPGTPSTAEKLGGAAQNVANRFASRGGASAATGVAGSVSTRAGGSIAAKAAGIGGRAIPLLGTALNIGLSAYRFSEGDVVGGILSAVSAIPVIGWAALGVDLAREFGAFDGTIFGKNGKDKLKQKTEEQKKLVESKKESGQILSFRKTLFGYERVVNKFEEFSKGFVGSMGMSDSQVKETAAKIEDLGGGSSPISAAGYEFTNQASFSQYLTGDPNAPGGAYDPSHGTVSNYHDHLAFKDAETARRAYNFLQSKGIIVTELGVSSGHTAGSAHYEGRAFDVPGSQWGGSGAIGAKEYAGSAKVRAFMNDFYNLESKSKSASTPTPRQSPTPVRPQPQRSTSTPAIAQPQRSIPRPMEPETSSYAISDPIIESYIDVPTPPTRPTLATYPSYDSRSQAGQIIPLPFTVPQQTQPQIMQQSPTPPMIMGPSEDQVLNSFYKRVLLNLLK